MSGQRGDWSGADTAQCVGMLVGAPLALAAWTGHLSIDQIRVYAQTALTWVVPTLITLGGVALAAGLALVLVRHLRSALVGAGRAWLVYRRRWASAMDQLQLSVPTSDSTRYPRIRSVVRVGAEDVVTVRILPGQAASGWQQKAIALAAEFGADAAQVRAGRMAHREIQLVFTRYPRPPRGGRPQLALEAAKPHPLPLALPQPDTQRERAWHEGPEYAIRLSGIRLEIIWANLWRRAENGSWERGPRGQRLRAQAQVRWCRQWAAI